MNWNRIRYGIWAPAYDAVLRWLPSLDDARRRSIARLELTPGQRVLIVGAGTGLDLPHLPEGLVVTAVDVTPGMLERLRRRAVRLRRDVDVRVMDGRALDFPDGAFDAVVLHLILAVMPEPDVGLREVERVLRGGGRAAVFDKFLQDGAPASRPRRLVNAAARLLATDINRQFGRMLAGTSLAVEQDTPSVFGGAYRIITLRKPV